MAKWLVDNVLLRWFIRLCRNTLQLVGALRKSRLSGAAGMTRGASACLRDGGPNRVEARQGEDGLASAQFRFDTPQLAAGSFIRISFQGD